MSSLNILTLKADKANLVTMFDRETRREKVLENMAKEARIRASSLADHNKGMKSAVISVKMKSKMIKEGFSALKEKVKGKTKEEELEEILVEQAEKNYFEKIQQIKEERISSGKPLTFTVTEGF